MSYISRLLVVFLAMTASFREVIAQDLAIPVMVGQTGASMIFGKPELDAYLLAVEEWNVQGGVLGRQVSLKVEDTQTNQRQIITAFQRLALDKPAVILGPTWLDGFPAVISLAQQKQILLVAPSAAREAFSKEDAEWPVTFYHNSTLEAKTLVAGLKERGHNRIAMIYEQEPFAEMIRQLVLQHLSSPVSDIGVQAGTDDYHAILSKLRAKKPDAFIVFIWNEKSLLSLLQQLRIHLPALQLATVHDGEGWLSNPVFRAVLPRLMYTKFVVKDPSFEEKFAKRFGYKPMLTASNAYDALNAVLKAYAKGSTTAIQIKQYLTEEEMETATFGKFKFAADGHVPSKVVVVDFP